MKLISVGSKNPVKVNAVANVVRKIWPDAKIVGVEVDSGISNQPKSDDEAISGAENRAIAAMKQANADLSRNAESGKDTNFSMNVNLNKGVDLSIGLEGHILDTKHGMFVSGWAVAIDKHGKKGLGNGGHMLLPEKIAAEIRNGGELGPTADKILGFTNIKQNQGVVGVLTNGMIDRTLASEKNIIFALSRFITPEHYEE